MRAWPIISAPVVTPPTPSEQPFPIVSFGSPKRIDVAAVPLKKPTCSGDNWLSVYGGEAVLNTYGRSNQEKLDSGMH